MARQANCLVVLLFTLQVSTAQDFFHSARPQARKAEAESYPVPGCQLLWKEEAEVQQYLSAHPELRTVGKISRTSAWGFNVGDTHSWWATNLVSKTEYSVPSTCRVVGQKYCYVFVEDSLWISGRVNQAAVDSIVAAFENRTPANPQKGIHEMDVQTFGNPPDVDNDPRIIILILDIKDGFSGSGAYTAGYFHSLNEYSQQLVDQSLPGRKSNNAEIYYIDGNPGNLTSVPGLAAATSTTAHEFQHMLHWNADYNEIAFINESCSEVASLVCGYSYTGQNRYTDNTDIYLLGWNGTLEDYSRAARWALYLWNQFPYGYLKMLVSNQAKGIDGMNNAFAQYQTPRRFGDVFVDWLVANQLNDAGVDPKYAYTFSSLLARPRALSQINPNTGVVTGSAAQLGADYIAFTSGSNLSITFTSGGSAVQVKAIETGPGGKRVMDVPLNTPFSEPAFGTSYTNVTFLVLNSSQTADASYSYQATGTSGSATAELKYDFAEPTGYLQNAAGDTVCVWFDAVPGAKLDSIRVALRRAGSMTGGIWRYTGSVRPSPLGRPLALPLTATVSSTPGIPYPMPWPNWATIDLRPYNLLSESALCSRVPVRGGIFESSASDGDPGAHAIHDHELHLLDNVREWTQLVLLPFEPSG